MSLWAGARSLAAARAFATTPEVRHRAPASLLGLSVSPAEGWLTFFPRLSSPGGQHAPGKLASPSWSASPSGKHAEIAGAAGAREELGPVASLMPVYLASTQEGPCSVSVCPTKKPYNGRRLRGDGQG